MKLGYLMAYNEVNWIGFTIDQAMMLCDKLLIIEGSQFADFYDISERSDDGTLDVISDKVKQYSKEIKVVNTVRENENYRVNQCANFNFGLTQCDIGDYLISIDADEFYLDSTIDEMNQLMDEGKIDYFTPEMLMFIFGFKWTFGTQNRITIFKKTPALIFRPTHQIKRGLGPVGIKSDKVSCHHYTLVKPRERMRIRMKTSGMYEGMLEWFDQNWDKTKLLEGGIFKYIHKLYTLKQYSGPHPSVLDKHPWKDIGDIRKL